MAHASSRVDVAQLLDMVADRDPHGKALTVDDDTVDFARLRELSLRAASLLAAAGAAQNQIVALPMANSIEQTAYLFGAWRLGATPLPLSPTMPAAELAKVLETADCGVLVRTAQGLADAPLWEGPYRLASRMRAQTSGGSTGVPKVIVDTQPSSIDVEGQGQRWGWTSGPALFVPGPTYHSGPINHLIEGLVRGRHVITMRRFDAERAARLITLHRPHLALFVPTMMSRLLKLPPEILAEVDFSSLTHLWHSAAYCPAWLKQRWIDLVGAEAVWEVFGGSEGCVVTIISGTEWLQHRGSVGRAFGGEIAIFDEAGEPVRAGEVGEIYMRSAVPRRFGVTSKVDRRLIGEWESFGDMGWLDENGYLYLADRRLNMINAGGQNVYPAEVEAALHSHPGVADAVVFGLPDDDLGEIVAASVWRIDPMLGEEQLISHLRTQLARYKLPRHIDFTAEPIRDDAGKVRRSALVARASRPSLRSA